MGEAKRRQQARRAEETRLVAAWYRPARTVLAYHRDLTDEAPAEMFLLALAAEMRCPNAVHPHRMGRTDAQVAALVGTAVLDDGDWHLFDLDEGYLGAAPWEGFPDGRRLDPQDPFRFYEWRGEAFALEAALSPEMRQDGRPVADAAARLSGLVRVLPDGAVVCPADQPMALQLQRIVEAGPAAIPHLRHLAAASLHLRGGGASAEEDAGFYGTQAGLLLGDAPRPAGWHWRAAVAAEMAGRAASLQRAGALRDVSMALGVDVEDWTGRGEPGTGHIWASWDRLIEEASGLRPPLRSRAIDVEPHHPDGQAFLAAVRRWLGRSERLHAEGGGPLVGTMGGAVLALVPGLDSHGVVAWALDGDEPPPDEVADPFAPQDLVGIDLAEMVLRRPDQRDAELAEMRLPEAFRGMLEFRNYPAAALAQAHLEGETLEGLSDAVVERVRFEAGLADRTRPVASGSLPHFPQPVDRVDEVLALARAPGPVSPWFVRALQHVDADYGLGGDVLDLAREVVLLREAHGRGATLLDLAHLVMARSRP